VDAGGGGAGFVELAIAAEILGRTLAAVPLIEAAVATTLLASLPAGPELEPLVAGAVAGDLLPTVALHPVAGAVARVVPAGAVADVVIVLRGEDLLAVRAADCPVTALANLGAMPVADRPVDPATALVVATGPEAVAAHRRAMAHWQLLTGAALVGLTGRALEIGIDYVMQRRAFGVLVPTSRPSSTPERRRHRARGRPPAGLRGGVGARRRPGDGRRPGRHVVPLRVGHGVHDGLGQPALPRRLRLHARVRHPALLPRAKAWPLVAGDRRRAYAELAHGLFDPGEA
jgi:hypothetical protein